MKKYFVLNLQNGITIEDFENIPCFVVKSQEKATELRDLFYQWKNNFDEEILDQWKRTYGEEAKKVLNDYLKKTPCPLPIKEGRNFILDFNNLYNYTIYIYEISGE